jgi:hypothetical protein
MTSIAKLKVMNLEDLARRSYLLTERLMLEVPDLSEELWRELQQLNNRISQHACVHDTEWIIEVEVDKG